MTPQKTLRNRNCAVVDITYLPRKEFPVMTQTARALLTLIFLLASPFCLLADPPPGLQKPTEKKASYTEVSKAQGGHVFAWPFISWEEMKPRGGSTRGSEVTLHTEPSAAWKALQEPDLSKQERDRRAILAMAGSYRVSFDFIETLGFSSDYKPPRPYFSWGTEYVHVLENTPEYISLQHALVMYFKDDKGEVLGPHILKHWRQDWTWQDHTIFQYSDVRTWKKVEIAKPKGRWSQAVYQVDDSPRYEVMGRWSHKGGLSTWRSDNCPRPLPRREFSTRDDYNILEGVHEITLSPTGWMHVQNNRKLMLGSDGTRKYVGTELGVNRYEAITSPELATGFLTYWEKTAPYWSDVRTVWSGLQNGQPRISLQPKVSEQKLWQHHFSRAGEIEKNGSNPEEDAQHARDTILSFLR